MTIGREYLVDCVNYDADSGVFTWLERPRNHFRTQRAFSIFNNRDAGTEAGSINPKGYRLIKIDGKRYMAHRLAWLYTNGEWPQNQIDHINGVKSDNRIENLRDVTQSENCRNMRRYSATPSGLMGVSWNRRLGRWQAYIGSLGLSRHLGFFDNFLDAAGARKSAELSLGYHANHGRAAQ